MISNERQYRTAQRQRNALGRELDSLVAETEDSLAVMLAPDARPSTDRAELVRQLEWASLTGQIAELDAEIAEYEALRSGKIATTSVRSLTELPDSLVRARITSGLSQRELADKLGLKEQQIQRYEAERYAGASLARLQNVMAVLGVELDAGVALPAQATASKLRRRLIDAGFDRGMVDRRLLRGVRGDRNDATVLAAVDRVSRLLAVPISTLLSGGELPALATTARFQAPRNASQVHLDAYTRYAEGIADIVLRATRRLGVQRPVGTARQMRDALDADLVHSGAGSVTSTDLLRATVRYAASIGVAVLALRDPAAFYGACFSTHNRAALVIKHTSDSPARWLAVLLHELDHVRDIPTAGPRSWVELGEIETWTDDPVEQRAHAFAADVLFAGRPGTVLAHTVNAAGGSVERLKSVVPAVAAQAEVPPDVLANYLAFRLSQRGLNWWPTAVGFQEAGDPWRVITDELLSHLDFTALDTADRQALLDALAP
jgi:transcriptional regulator with XRE-family HTH domain